MFAIIKAGGKQYRVSEGDSLIVEKIASAVGDKVEFKDVLLVADGKKITVGRPRIKNAVVRAEIEGEPKAKKLYPFKKKKRKKYRRRIGHRQSMSLIRVKEIKIKETVKKAAH